MNPRIALAGATSTIGASGRNASSPSTACSASPNWQLANRAIATALRITLFVGGFAVEASDDVFEFR